MSLVVEGAIVVCRGPRMREFRREDWGVHWCFRCRRHLQHEAVLMVAEEGEEDWYGPHWRVECEGCGEDHVRFPGTEDGPTLEVSYG